MAHLPGVIWEAQRKQGAIAVGRTTGTASRAVDEGPSRDVADLGAGSSLSWITPVG
jgi:hypothetical protein